MQDLFNHIKMDQLILLQSGFVFYVCLRQNRSGVQKSDNLQYNMLGRWFAGTNDSSNKHLMFQVLFFSYFLQKSLQESFQFIFLFFYNLQK